MTEEASGAAVVGPQIEIVEVSGLAGMEKPLAYAVPGRMKGALALGSLVRVPLGKTSRVGVVTRLGSHEHVPEGKLKYLFEALYDVPVLTPELLQLAGWIHAYYAAPLEQVFETMVPAAVRGGMKAKLEKLLAAGAHLPEEDLAKLRRQAPKQAEVYEFLRTQFQALPKSLVMGRLKAAASTVDALVRRGLVKEISQERERSAYSDEFAQMEAVSPKPFNLNEEQQAALDDLSQSLHAREFRPHLLHGITGSGKTEVYLQAMRVALQEGGGVIYLVPEVALTPQTVARLRARLEDLGVKVVVWHSHLSAGERFDGWLAVARGQAQVVVGARSAIFAPVRDLRLIVVDEEHEPAYKQEETPRYHARDVAVYRAHLRKAVCVLGSATPSLESLYNVQVKDYRLNRLTRRIDDRQLPTLHIVDMKRELLRARGGPIVVSQPLKEKLLDRLERKEQAILFINRRGYSSSLLCPDCSYLALCPHCSVTLTFHRTDNRLRCHLCGHNVSAPLRCPQCNSDKIRWRGFGTQRVEEVVQKILPRARIVRLDADAMSKKNLFREILGDFRLGKIDILVGTQMIAKGLDFPNVTLVGLLDADISLHIPDFRASERTFQLLVQVAGRAGRGDRAGEVVVQTFTPHSPPVQFARRADFDGFLQEELALRQEFHYPPYRHVVRHLFRGRNPDKVAFFAEQWTRLLEAHAPEGLEVRGPAPAPLEKVKDFYRFQTWYFVGQVSRVVPQIVKLRSTFPMDPEVADLLDVDPVDLA